MIVAYLAFGGNIGAVQDRIITAWDFLGGEPTIELLARSKMYQTEPVGGPQGQDDYINAVARVQTSLTPRFLLDVCLDVERRLGRRRVERWGPRSIDIDLILYGNEVIDEPGLTVPHPRLRERLFVLVPLADVATAELELPPYGIKLQDALRAELHARGETLDMWQQRVI